MIGYFTIAIASFLGMVMSGPYEDIVYKMPWVKDEDQPDFNLWSGYINIFGSSKMIHYFFVESANDPVNDPLIIWYNGGPGCSSMLGFMQEHGPFLWETGQSNWTGKNPWSWNQKANMLYIEQPAGVGYSYFADAADIGFNFTDYNAAQDNLQAVLGWYEKFPEFKSNDLYLSGESYAGIYVPFLLYQMDHHNEINRGNPNVFKPNLRGMMVGNGVTNWNYDTTPGAFEMSYWHTLIDKDLYSSAIDLGCIFNGQLGSISPECDDIAGQFDELWDGNLNIYDIFGECWHEPNKTGPTWSPRDYTPWAFRKNMYNSPHDKEKLKGLPVCTFGNPIITYLNDADVMKALNIPVGIPRLNATEHNWDLCRDADDGFIYSPNPKGSQWIWEALIGKYRFLKFSGDTDAAVPTTGTKWWIQSMGLTVLRDWKPYLVEDERGGQSLGGYTIEYDGLTLGTVHGAGHMAPQFKPPETYHLIMNWLQEKEI